MTQTSMNAPTPRRPPRSRLGVAAAAFAALIVSCTANDILTVQDPDVALPKTVSDSVSLPAVLAGALGNFGVAYNGSNTDVNLVSLSGLITDEFINTETFPTRIEIDRRQQRYQLNGSLTGLFYAAQQARASADLAADGYRKFLPNDPGLALALNLSALTIVMMAENYCGAVPLSQQLPSGDFLYGPSLITRDLLGRAIAKADSAQAALGGAASNAPQARVARIIKARALLDLDDPANAALAIGGTAGVPTNFAYMYAHSETTPRQNNGTWNLVQNSGRFGVGNSEGINGLPFRSEGDTLAAGGIRDPRVANVRRPSNRGLGFDGATPMWWQLIYPVRAAPTIIADGVEARLIEAEAALRAGNYPATLATLNALNSDASVRAVRGYTRQPPQLTPAVTYNAQVDQLFKERAYWLYLTSHRLGDVRRLSRPLSATAPDITGYGRGTETVYPTGAYFKGGTYGTDVNSPIPQAEDNNPSFVRASCDITKP